MFLDDFTMTRHAVSRALDMGIDANEIAECLLRPEMVKPSKSYANTKNYDHGRITLAIRDDHAVVTILWRGAKNWEADLANGEYAGREHRPSCGRAAV